MTSPAGDRLGLGSDRITWEQFEQFCLALLNALPEVESATRYGVPGEHQEGIDIEVRFADGRTGGVQCRQRGRFGKPEFDQAVKDNEYEADRHIVMTTAPATVPARKAERQAPDWEIWDIDDLGVKVRQRLPRVDARWLVEDHLGAPAGRAFLGPDGPLTLARWRRHFAPLLRPNRLFSHTVELVGRDDVLAEFEDFLRDEARQVLVLPGRGGTGKSRLLLEFARRSDDDGRPVLFAMDGATLAPDQLDADLPAGPAVLVLDDAQRRRDIAEALNYAARRENLKVVLVTRPLRIEELDAALIQAGFDASNLRRLEPLSTLGFDDARRLASAALGVGRAVPGGVLDALGEMTRDCQLITVLGARVLATEDIPVGRLGNADALRNHVLGAFVDERLGRVSDQIPVPTAQALLELVSALQPVHDDDRALEGIASRLDATPDGIIRWLDILEDAGVLLRGGRLRRVTPDVLGDYVLEERAFDNRGAPSGFADQLWEDFAEIAGARLMRNLAELDWRVANEAGASALLDRIWERLHSEFEASDAYGRTQLLELIAEVAVLQPARVLALADVEIRHPARPHEIPALGVRWDTVNVQRKLTPLVRDAGYKPSLTRRVMRVLWALGRDDDRPQPQNTDHGLRLLAELGSYQWAPASWSALVDTVEDLLADRQQDGPSPVSLLARLLAREELSTRARGRGAIAMLPHLIDAQATRPIRERVISILAREAAGQGRDAMAAVEVLDRGLSLPHGYFNQAVPAEAVDQWETEQSLLVRTLRDALATAEDPRLAAAIRRGLGDEAERGRWPNVQGEARSALADYPPTLFEQLVDLFEQPWPFLDEAPRDETADALAAGVPSADEAAAELNRALDTVAGVEANPNILLGTLANRHPELAEQLLARAIDHPDEPLTAHAGVFLPRQRPAIAARLWRSDVPVLRRLAAEAYARDPTNLDEEDRSKLVEMLRDSDGLVRIKAINAVFYLASQDQGLATTLAAQADPQTAHEIDLLVHAVDAESAEDADLEVFCDWLKRSAIGYAGAEFLQALAPRRPDLAIAVLRAMAQGDDLVRLDSQPNVLEKLDPNDYEGAIRQLRDAAVDNGIPPWRLAYVLSAVGREDFSELVDVLAEWLTDDNEERARAGAEMAHGLPSHVIFDLAPRIAAVIDRAARQGHAELVRGELFAAAVSGGTTRSHGVAAPEDVERLERATEIERSLPDGAPVREFYADLRRHFAQHIEDDLRRDEEEEL